MARKILLVDDEAVLVETIAYNLEQAGYQVTTASDGASALEAVRCETPDLIILDIMLPEMDGSSVGKALFERYGPTVPIVVVSAVQHDTLRAVAEHLNAFDYLSKPFDIEALVAAVQRACVEEQRRSRSTDEASQ